MAHDVTPLEVCERLIGKPELLAGLFGYESDKAPYNWRHATSTRDAGDIPSARLMRALLAHSDAHALGLTAAHLILGASEAEVQAILSARHTDQNQVAA